VLLVSVVLKQELEFRRRRGRAKEAIVAIASTSEEKGPLPVVVAPPRGINDGSTGIIDGSTVGGCCRDNMIHKYVDQWVGWLVGRWVGCREKVLDLWLLIRNQYNS
jgi:hypothetical protein